MTIAYPKYVYARLYSYVFWTRESIPMAYFGIGTTHYIINDHFMLQPGTVNNQKLPQSAFIIKAINIYYLLSPFIITIFFIQHLFRLLQQYYCYNVTG